MQVSRAGFNVQRVSTTFKSSFHHVNFYVALLIKFVLLLSGTFQCERTLEASHVYKVLESPNYPNLYPHGLECVYIITAPPGQLITLQVGEHQFKMCVDCGATLWLRLFKCLNFFFCWKVWKTKTVISFYCVNDWFVEPDLWKFLFLMLNCR